MIKEKVLVVGGDSLIGSACVKYLKQINVPVISSTRRVDSLSEERVFIDLSKISDRIILDKSVGIAVLCAGATRMADCQQNPRQSSYINVTGIYDLVKILVERGVHILYLSTNQVFDGLSLYPSPNDPVSPITEYGKQKTDAENKLLKSYADMLTILRLTKVIGNREFLFDKWIDELREGKSINPFSDMFLAPISLSLVVSVIVKILNIRPKGIYHLSAECDISYEQAACKAVEILGVNNDQVQPISAMGSGIVKSPYPIKTAMNIDSTKLEFAIKPPDPMMAIEKYILNKIDYKDK